MRKGSENKVKQVLTFVDMSKLKYLSRSVNTNSDQLSRRKHTQVKLPQNTSSAIVEAASEEDSDEQDPNKVVDEDDKANKTEATPKDFAVEVLNEIIAIVLESAGEAKTLESSEVVNNALL